MWAFHFHYCLIVCTFLFYFFWFCAFIYLKLIRITKLCCCTALCFGIGIKYFSTTLISVVLRNIHCQYCTKNHQFFSFSSLLTCVFTIKKIGCVSGTFLPQNAKKPPLTLTFYNSVYSPYEKWLATCWWLWTSSTTCLWRTWGSFVEPSFMRTATRLQSFWIIDGMETLAFDSWVLKTSQASGWIDVAGYLILIYLNIWWIP